MVDFLIETTAAFFAGIFASMGLGGGFVLIIYLAAFLSMPQLEAQGINLIFFLPIAALSLILHTRNKLVQWRLIPLACAFGVIGALGGVALANLFSQELLRKLFAALLLLVGIHEVFHKPQKRNESKNDLHKQ